MWPEFEEFDVHWKPFDYCDLALMKYSLMVSGLASAVVVDVYSSV